MLLIYYCTLSGPRGQLFNTYHDLVHEVNYLIPITIWLSGWLLFNANSAIFQLYHGENKLIFNEMMMRSVLF